MFLRKLFSRESKFKWVLVDLIIVVIGVYTAFLIQKYSAGRANDREKDKVLTALKFELETFRIQFPDFASYMDNYSKEVSLEAEPDFSNWRYIEPQYAYQIIEYAMNVQNGDIVDFQLYDDLQKLFVRIKQLEHTEREITQLSGRYKRPIDSLPADHPHNLARRADNAGDFFRFMLFVRTRSQVLKDIAKTSSETLVLINTMLGSDKVKEIEREIIMSSLGRVETEEQAVQMVRDLFPSFTEQEVREMYLEYRENI